MADPKDELIEFAYNKTVCQLRPEVCKPREIEHVSWDADDTMWHIEPYAIASNISGKLTLVSPDVVEAEEFSGPKHAYPTVTTPKKPPPRKKKKRAWQIATDEELEEWWQGKMDLGTKRDEELKSISEELIESLDEDGVMVEENDFELANSAEKDKPVYLDDIEGWDKAQLNSVDNLLKRYGKKICKVVDVRSNGTLDIDCRGDIWMLTKDGRLIGEGKEPPPKSERKYTSYQPRKITITLLPTFRETIKKLKDKRITNSVISLNSPGSVSRIIKAFGMEDDFVEIRDTWENKGKVFDDIAEKNEICPCNMIFVDNTLSHVKEVSKKCGLPLQIGKGRDVEKPIDVLKFIKDNGN